MAKDETREYLIERMLWDALPLSPVKPKELGPTIPEFIKKRYPLPAYPPLLTKESTGDEITENGRQFNAAQDAEIEAHRNRYRDAMAAQAYGNQARMVPEKTIQSPGAPMEAERSSTHKGGWDDWLSLGLKPTAPQLAQGVANGTLPSQQPTIQLGGNDDQAAQDYRDMRAARYYASLDGKPGANTLNPLASALFGNQVGAFLNYGNSLDRAYNSPVGPYGQFQDAATQQRPYAAQERIAAMNNQTERQKIGVTSKLVDQLLGSAQNTKPLAGVATDYGAGVAVPYETGPSNWRKYRGRQTANG